MRDENGGREYEKRMEMLKLQHSSWCDRKWQFNSSIQGGGICRNQGSDDGRVQKMSQNEHHCGASHHRESGINTM